MSSNPNLETNQFYPAMVAAGLRFISVKIPKSTQEQYQLSRYSEPAAIPSHIIMAMARDLDIPVVEFLSNHVGSLRYSYLEYCIASREAYV